MTNGTPLDAWLAARVPVPPRELAERVRAEVADRGSAAPADPADALLAAAEEAMRRVLAGGCLTRASALDLLVVDALVTYAFEAAADDPLALETRAAQALATIAALAEPYEA